MWDNFLQTDVISQRAKAMLEPKKTNEQFSFSLSILSFVPNALHVHHRSCNRTARN